MSYPERFIWLRAIDALKRGSVFSEITRSQRPLCKAASMVAMS